MEDQGEAAARLRVQLFGPFRVWRDDAIISDREWKTRQHQALFQLLVSRRGAFFHREVLIEQIWPDANPDKAGISLRNRVSELRRILEPGLQRGRDSRFILTRPEGYSFNEEADCLVDLEEFDRHRRRARALHREGRWLEAVREYEAALQWCQGDFLEADLYVEWTQQPRERWRESRLGALTHLAECYARVGQYERAIERARHTVELHDDWELGYLQLMRTLLLAGRRAEALRVYERCRKVLKENLGLEVSAEMEALRDQLARGETPRIEQLYPPLMAPPSLSHQGEIPFVDREAELRYLEHHWDRARSGRGRVVLLSGEAGVGKSRLAKELLDRARRKGSLVLQGHCGSDRPYGPYAPLVEGLRQAVPQLAPGDLKGLEPVWLAETLQLVPALRRVVHSVSQALPPLPPEGRAERRREALTRFVMELARSSNYAPPLVLFLDDLQRASGTLLEWLSALLHRMRARPLLVLGAHRTEAVEGERAFARWRQEVGSTAPDVYELILSPIPEPELEDLVAHMAPELPAARRRRLVRRSGGHPLYLLALLSQEIEAGSLGVSSAPRRMEHAPSRLTRFLERRLERLTHEERRLLRIAAVLGERFERELLERVWGSDSASLDDLLAGLIERRWLDPLPGGYAFAHEVMRETVYRALGGERRVLHRRAAEAIAALHRRDLGPWAATLAHHYCEAQLSERALAWARNAAGLAVQSYENEEGLKLIELGLRAANALEDDDQVRLTTGDLAAARCELLMRRATLLDRLGLREEQGATLRELEQLLPAVEDDDVRARVLELRTQWARTQARHPEAEAYAQAALALRQKQGDPAGVGRALLDLGRVYWAWGRPEEAVRRYREALEHFQIGNDPAGEAAAWNNVGVIKRSLGDYQESLDCLERALIKRKEAGEQLEAAQTLANVGNVLWALGRVHQGLERYREAYEVFRGVGHRRSEGKISFNIGLAYGDLGQYERALEWYGRAERIFREIADPKGEGETLGDVGLIYAECGRFERAREALRRARKLLAAVEDRRALAKAISNLGVLYLRWGKPRRAIPFFQTAYRLRRELGDRRRQGLNLSHLGAAYLSLGSPRRAVRYLGRALSHLESVGVRSLEIEVLSRLSLAELGGGNLAHAQRISERAIALLEGGGPELEGLEHPEEVHYARFQVLRAGGRSEEALAHLERAYQVITRRAAGLSDPSLRESFLAQVPLNREIVRAYEQTMNDEAD